VVERATGQALGGGGERPREMISKQAKWFLVRRREGFALGACDGVSECDSETQSVCVLMQRMPMLCLFVPGRGPSMFSTVFQLRCSSCIWRATVCFWCSSALLRVCNCQRARSSAHGGTNDMHEAGSVKNTAAKARIRAKFHSCRAQVPLTRGPGAKLCGWQGLCR
jgi:hypothetical protein